MGPGYWHTAFVGTGGLRFCPQITALACPLMVRISPFSRLVAEQELTEEARMFTSVTLSLLSGFVWGWGGGASLARFCQEPLEIPVIRGGHLVKGIICQPGTMEG